MNWREAKSLLTLRDQINAMFPGRNKASDGTIGDARHQAEKSDHNPNAAGVVTAFDVTHDPAGCTGDWLATVLQNSKDPRIKYLIWNRRITVHGDITKWSAYHGASPHTEHVHISVSADPKLYDDDRTWNLASSAETLPIAHPQIQYGLHSPQVGIMQNALNAHGFPVKVDNFFGPDTEKALNKFQQSVGLDADGICGPMTWKALGF